MNTEKFTLFCFLQSPKLKTEYCYKTQYRKPGFTNGVKQFRRYQYLFVRTIIFMVSFIFTFYFLFIYVNLHKCDYPKKETQEFRWTILLDFRLSNFLVVLRTTVHNQNINKQIINSSGWNSYELQFLREELLCKYSYFKVVLIFCTAVYCLWAVK